MEMKNRKDWAADRSTRNASFLFDRSGERGSLGNESDNKEMESQGWRLIYTRNNTDRMRRKRFLLLVEF